MGDTLYTVMTTRASAVLTNYVLPKHCSFLFLWVGEICYFDILSNCEQSLLATFYDNNWTKCSCTFIIINNYMYLHFKLSLQFLDELEMSMFLCKKNKLYVYVFMSAPKKVNKNIQKVYPCLISSLSILSLCTSQKVKASFFTLHFHNRAKAFFNCTFNLDPRPPSFSSCKSPPQKTFCHGHRRFPLGWQPLQRGP